jgi:hypothetical protein
MRTWVIATVVDNSRAGNADISVTVTSRSYGETDAIGVLARYVAECAQLDGLQLPIWSQAERYGQEDACKLDFGDGMFIVARTLRAAMEKVVFEYGDD